MTRMPNTGLDDVGTRHAVEQVSHGGRLATALSAIALIFSGFSFYESSLKSADLAIYVPPMIHYARDGDNDVFNVPVTITNDGAKSGTVLNMELVAENLRDGADRKTARFHSAFVGEHPRTDEIINRSFAPISIPGNGTFTETIRFYPMENPLPFLVDDKGDYRFTLKLVTPEPQRASILDVLPARTPAPLSFEMKLPFISFQHLSFRRGTIAMFNKDWKPATSESQAETETPPAQSAPQATPPAAP
ncbi:MAG: hypothetical protein CTY28_09180 [Hyphomicrobium sp.]|nr:MAG: hypothetical protein CTY28_09180 [Hyphomicrobium sp.]